MESNLKKVCGLWLNDGKKGKYMSGKAQENLRIPEGAKLFVFKNNKKESDKHPDYNLMYAAEEQQQEQQPAEDDIGF